MSYVMPDGVHDGVRCPNCGDKPLRCDSGHCLDCGHLIAVATASEVKV